MKNYYKKDGFTLVELMVSVGITAVLMVGIATFFSSTFRSMFVAREKVGNTQEQFVVNTILGGKFVNVGKVQEWGPATGPTSPYVVLRNDMETGDLPFTYIGKGTFDGAEHIIFKDFFVFNGKYIDIDSKDSGAFWNPGGLTKLGGEYFVTVPLENTIYKCSDPELMVCEDLVIEDLNQPIDVTNDGVDLYVTDAANDRVVKLEDPTGTKNVKEVANGFNYPTGIAFYSNGGTDYLFVADTYNHQIKKVQLPGGSSEVVVGDGDDEDCDRDVDDRDHTALFCKLNFPTDVMVGSKSGVDALFISDTGNGRVLRVWDPDPDLTDVELPLSLLGSTQISRLDFVLPDDSSITSYSEGVSGNSLHKVKYSDSEPIITASLTDQTTINHIVPVCSGDPLDCTDYFRGFYVNSANNIFEFGDDLDISGGNYKVSDVSDEGGDNWKVAVTPLNTTINPPAGTNVRITKNFSGDHTFYLDLSDIDFPDAFNLIKMEVYNELAALNNDPPEFVTVRIGDGELGTFEDTIEVVDGESGHTFPTGLGWNDGILEVSVAPGYSLDFPDYDYISDFEVQNFGFSEPNAGEVLEMEFEAKLGEDAEGNPIWEESTLNANVKE